SVRLLNEFTKAKATDKEQRTGAKSSPTWRAFRTEYVSASITQLQLLACLILQNLRPFNAIPKARRGLTNLFQPRPSLVFSHPQYINKHSKTIHAHCPSLSFMMYYKAYTKKGNHEIRI
ncbi:hypothetical protein GE21DRAFT_1201368, partial [Neurospora crassa]